MNLDLKDKKLLAEIEMNARINLSSLGKRIGVSKQSVAYRINKLESKKIIQGYNALIDISKLSKTIYVIYLKLVKISSSEEKTWIENIEKHIKVLAVGKNAGNWDLTLVIGCKTNKELDEVLKELLSQKADKIREKLITSEIGSIYFSTNLIYKSKNIKFKTSEVQEEIKIDQKDEQILFYLSKKCRVSLLALSKKVNMSPNGVKNKIKILEDKKIILGYKTKINYELLGYLQFRVFLHLKKFTPETFSKISTFLNSKGNVESVSRYLGYADIDFRCYVKGVVEVHDLISEIKDAFLQNVVEVDSTMIFGWEKMDYYPS